jgi:hypothetical protein
VVPSGSVTRIGFEVGRGHAAGMIDREKVTGGSSVDDRFGGRGWGSIGGGEKGRFIAITRVRR